MKHVECNPEGLADPDEGNHVNPALKACVEALTEGLKAAGVSEASFVVVLFTPKPNHEGTLVRMASSDEPEAANKLLKMVANEGHDVVPMGMAFEMVNTLCRSVKVRELSPADFVLLMHKVAAANAPTAH